MSGREDALEREADRMADHASAAPLQRAVDDTPPRTSGNAQRSSGQLGTGLADTGLALRGSGHALASDLRDDMERRFGHDFSNVRVHTGADAAEAAAALDARAFTLGSDVVFGANEYAGTRAGRRVVAHELAHVVQQDREGGVAMALGRPLVQRLPVGPEPVDPFDRFKQYVRDQLREAARRPPPPPPTVPAIPGDLGQQYEVFKISGEALWDRPDVQARMKQLAAQVEQKEAKQHPGGKVEHTQLNMFNYWNERFATSVEYILTKREIAKDPENSKIGISSQKWFRRELELDENKLLKTVQGDDLIAQVVALRDAYKQRWAANVEHAVQRFVELAENEADLITSEHRPQPARVLGLPEGLEKTVGSAEAPKQLEKGATPVAASVITFMKAVQQESGTKDVAENYPGHEKDNAHFRDDSIGKYSFDVHPSIEVDPETGFYDRAKLITFFKAVERASAKTNIEWNAYYNDAAVIKEFNDFVGKGRVGFSGGGGGGSFHHGPEPFILHIHFNIMPTDLANKFLVGTALVRAEKILEAYWKQVDAHF